MVRNALEQGRQSMVADGLTMSRYPSYVHQFISSFSLWWICMGHDYWMYRGDEDYLRTLLPAYREILTWYERWLKPDYSLDYVLQPGLRALLVLCRLGGRVRLW